MYQQPDEQAGCTPSRTSWSLRRTLLLRLIFLVTSPTLVGLVLVILTRA